MSRIALGEKHTRGPWDLTTSKGRVCSLYFCTARCSAFHQEALPWFPLHQVAGAIPTHLALLLSDLLFIIIFLFSMSVTVLTSQSSDAEEILQRAHALPPASQSLVQLALDNPHAWLDRFCAFVTAYWEECFQEE